MKDNLKTVKFQSVFAGTVFFLFSIFSFSANATDYYFSANGNDGNSGTSASAPWQTLNKFNSTTFRPGDNIFFNRGDVFYGSINIRYSGASGNPITIGAYGSGSNPEITGFTNVSSWNNLGGNIWESSNPVSSLSSCNMVTVNGSKIAMGRYPNSGYLSYQSYNGNTSITSSSLNGTDWTGAEVVIRKQRWILDRNPITSQSGTTLGYKSSSSYNGQNNWGFFIQNDSRTLDQQNEWYYNPATNKIKIYSNSYPSGVQLSSIDNVINIRGNSNIIFNNLTISGGNKDGFYVTGSNNISINNCNISFCYNAIYGTNIGQSSNNFSLQNSLITNINNNAISLSTEFTNANIQNNLIRNIGMIQGLGGSGDGNYEGINLDGAYSLVQYNEVDSIGYVGIGFNGNYIKIKNNLVNYFCALLDDGGGIYSGNPATGNEVSNNIVLNGIGNGDGTTNKGSRAEGIFIDDNGSGVQILNNSVANIGYWGIMLRNGNNIDIKGNTTYNCNGINVYNDNPNVYTTNITSQQNIFFANLSGTPFTSQNQLSVNFATVHNDIQNFGSSSSIDYNFYARPIDDNLTCVGTLFGVTDNFYNLAQWQSYSGYDAHSKKSPKTVSDNSSLKFVYNASTANTTLPLDGSYVDVKNAVYNGQITLAPYTSAALIKTGPATGNKAPVANAGSNGSITLPTNTTTLSGSGTDADGTISSYNWTELSGPSTATITSPNSATTSVSGMVQGIYLFQLQVTDNNGATGQATVQISVINATVAGNVPPVANAGGDGTITLPTNAVTLSGSGTDADGTIAGYSWTEVSGPSAANITSPNTSSTGIKGMIAGLYQFQLTVTDNSGATGSSTVNIKVVNSANSNISPVANAGGDGTITLPINSVPLAGTGTDADGTIVGYNWSQVSGPSAASIISPNTAATLVTGMIAGTYQFQLTVTDNLGATGTSTVNIRVNGSSNISPIANAGGDGTIILPINSVPLTGSGTDADGTIVGYNWSQVSGPSAASITSPNTSATLVTGMISGNYQFQLTVTDNLGATGTSTVSIRVVNTALSGSIANTTSISVPVVVGVTAYPNPFTDYINLSITGGIAGSYDVIMADASGQVVWNKTGVMNSATLQLTINTSTLKSGIYFLKFNQNNSNSVIKLVKVK